MKNHVELMGRIVSTPKLTSYNTKDGVKHTKLFFRLASLEKFTKRDGSKGSIKLLHNIVIWNHQAKYYSQMLEYGKQLLVEGRIRYRRYKMCSITEIHSKRVFVLAAPNTLFINDEEFDDDEEFDEEFVDEEFVDDEDSRTRYGIDTYETEEPDAGEEI